MQIISKKLLEKAMKKLLDNKKFLHDCRGFSGTITFEDEENAAYVTFFRGKFIEIGEGYSVFGSDFYITATADNWKKVFLEVPEAYGIFESNGDLIRLKGNQYVYLANALAFYDIWQGVKSAFKELEGVTDNG